MIFYTGSYTDNDSPFKGSKGVGIGCFNFDEITGGIEHLHYTKQCNPSYLTISKNLSYLYAAEELLESENPKIFAYKIERDGKLSLLNSQKLTGSFACHLAIVENHLVVANYLSGNALSFSIMKDGSLRPYHQIIKHIGTGKNKERQEGPHVHMVYPFNDNCIYLADLGIDLLKAYKMNTMSNSWEAISRLDVSIKSGAGARHLVMNTSNTAIFVLSELSGEVFVFKKQEDRFELAQIVNFIPDNYHGSFGGAAIKIHSNEEFLYCSSRGADTISIFRIDKKTKMLSLIDYQSTEGKTPRDFSIHPSGNWLIVANQDSDILVVFKINQQTGTLEQSSVFKVKTPVNICWLPDN